MSAVAANVASGASAGSAGSGASAARAGIVRIARRPAGWIAPGPRPAGPGEDPRLWPAPGEDLCHLAGDFRIFQRTGGHRWSLDDLVTAHFAAEYFAAEHGAAERRALPAHFVDLGCGIGSVLMLLAWRFPNARGFGVEAQAESVALARRSLAWNGIAERCRVLHADLRDPQILAGESFDLVTATPPYLPLSDAVASSDPQRLACRLETRGGVEAYCTTGARLLAPGGRLVLCMTGGPEGRVGRGAAEAGLAIERWRDVVPRSRKDPLFGVFVLGRAGEVRGLRTLAPLVVRDESAAWTADFRALRRAMGMPAGEES